ncbi:MAG: hypothetical protein BMS9Abin28_1739 [Anaerolineae bacterium]|nr:MAG: hypothetical protein BMS9Abin28_1739 [Anaerolineae bacterium]
MSEIKVAIASDSALIREGIEALLSARPGVDVVGTSNAGSEAIREAQKSQARILVFDMPEPKSLSLELLARLGRELPELSLIAVSHRRDEPPIQNVLREGVHGYLCSQEGAEELVEAVLAVAEGGSYLCPEASGVLVRHYRSKVTICTGKVANDSGKRSPSQSA